VSDVASQYPVDALIHGKPTRFIEKQEHSPIPSVR
jgi:hypothetical protein